MTATGKPLRVVLAGLAGGIAWIAAMAVFFGPAQAILANPAYQSAKFLAAFNPEGPDAGRAATAPWIVPIGILLLGIVHAAAYAGVRSALGTASWRRGLRFGVLAWALQALWFEFYLPWNVMREPAALVILELVLWLLVLLASGTAIAWVYERGARSAS